MTSIVIFRLKISLSPMPMSITNSQVLSIVWLTSLISKTLMGGLHVVDQQMMSGTTSVLFMRIFMGMLFVPKLSSYTISMYCSSSPLWYWYVICDLSISNNIFFCPFGILWYKFLSYREVLHVLSEPSELSKLLELIELPEVFSSMKKHLLHSALRPGDLLLELRFVSWSSETSRSIGTPQSSISLCSAFPDAADLVTEGSLPNSWAQVCWPLRASLSLGELVITCQGWYSS